MAALQRRKTKRNLLDEGGEGGEYFESTAAEGDAEDVSAAGGMPRYSLVGDYDGDEYLVSEGALTPLGPASAPAPVAKAGNRNSVA